MDTFQFEFFNRNNGTPAKTQRTILYCEIGGQIRRKRVEFLFGSGRLETFKDKRVHNTDSGGIAEQLDRIRKNENASPVKNNATDVGTRIPITARSLFVRAGKKNFHA